MGLLLSTSIAIILTKFQLQLQLIVKIFRLFKPEKLKISAGVNIIPPQGWTENWFPLTFSYRWSMIISMSQKGFVPLIYIIILILIGGGIIGVGLYIKNSSSKVNNTSNPAPVLFDSTPSPQITSSPSPSSKPTPKPVVVVSPSTIPIISPTPMPVSIPTPAPVAKVTCTINASVSEGWSPASVYFSYTASDQSRVTGSSWDLDGDGTWESETSTPNWTYKDVKSYEAKLKLKLADGSYSDICSKTITVKPPSITCNINADVTSGKAPLAVNFTYGAELHGVSDDYVTIVQWDFNGDGAWDTPYDYLSQHPPVYTFSNPGNYTAKMHLKTNKGVETDICTKSITVN